MRQNNDLVNQDAMRSELEALEERAWAAESQARKDMNKDWPEAARQMLASDWRVQVGDRALVLARIMETGVMPDATV